MKGKNQTMSNGDMIKSQYIAHQQAGDISQNSLNYTSLGDGKTCHKIIKV